MTITKRPIGRPALSALCLGLLGWGGWCMAQESPGDRAERIHREAIVIDGHSDTTPKFEDPRWDFGARHDDGHMDLPRTREGGLDAQFFSIYMPETPGDGRAIKTALRRIDAVYETVRKHAGDMELVTTADGIRDAVSRGKIAALMGMEGGHIIENELSALRMFHQLGVRYMTLTHSFHTDWADAAGLGQSVTPRHNGLTGFGREIVLEMNRLGMMVDISHVADTTFWHVIETTKAPVIASHSSCRAIADHPRNMSDDMLRALAANGGVIMINFFTGFIDPGRAAAMGEFARQREILREQFKDEPGRLMAELRRITDEFRSGDKIPASVVVDHIDHAIAVAGPDHVGLGSDWDGVAELPEGLDEVSKLPYVTEEMLRRGHDEATIKKVLGGNLLRVMETVEAVAAAWPESAG